jgi:hypothetical protein
MYLFQATKLQKPLDKENHFHLFHEQVRSELSINEAFEISSLSPMLKTLLQH